MPWLTQGAFPAWQRVGCISSWLEGCLSHWFWLSCGLARAITSTRGRAPKYLAGGRRRSVPPLFLSLTPSTLVAVAVTLNCFAAGVLHHGSEVWRTALEANAVVILRLTDLDSCLEGGLIYPPEKVKHVSARIDASVTVILEVLHLLVDLFVADNVRRKLLCLCSPLHLRVQNFLMQVSAGVFPTMSLIVV